jgi:hypothetical protein
MIGEDSIRVYAVEASGHMFGAPVRWWTNVEGNYPIKALILKRKREWLVFKCEPVMYGPIPEKIIGRAWASGNDGVAFPTLTVARTFAALC